MGNLSLTLFGVCKGKRPRHRPDSRNIFQLVLLKWAAPSDRRLCESDDMGVGTYITLDM